MIEPERIKPNRGASPCDLRASNPGGLDVDEGFYRRCFPDRPLNRRQFSAGCVCPAQVISTDPYLVAVFADLRNRPDGCCPAVKVVAQPLSKHISVGARLAACALYYPGESQSRWATFDPVVVNCVTPVVSTVEHTLASIPPEEWEELKQCLKSVTAPFDADVQYIFNADYTLSHKEIQHAPEEPAAESEFTSKPTAVYRGSIGLLTLVMAIFLAGSGVLGYDMIKNGLASYQDDLWEVGLVVATWVIYAALIAFTSTMRLAVHPEGLKWRGPRKGKGWVRWEDITQYAVVLGTNPDHYGLEHVIARWIGRKTRWRFSTAHPNTSLRLTLSDGRQVTLSNYYGSAFKLFGKIIDRLDPRYVLEARLYLRQGVPIEFGHMWCHPSEMRWGKLAIPYDAIREWRILDGVLSVRVEGGDLKHYSVGNAYALETVLKGMG